MTFKSVFPNRVPSSFRTGITSSSLAVPTSCSTWGISVTYNDPTCPVEAGQDCFETKCVYKIMCDQCNTEVDHQVQSVETHENPSYTSMTETSLHNRMKKHTEHKRLGNLTGPLTRHDMNAHCGVKQKYITTVIA